MLTIADVSRVSGDAMSPTTRAERVAARRMPQRGQGRWPQLACSPPPVAAPSRQLVRPPRRCPRWWRSVYALHSDAPGGSRALEEKLDAPSEHELRTVRRGRRCEEQGGVRRLVRVRLPAPARSLVQAHCVGVPPPPSMGSQHAVRSTGGEKDVGRRTSARGPGLDDHRLWDGGAGESGVGRLSRRRG